MNKFQVVLDHHHKDMIFINWAMSTILICWMIFINLPGKFIELHRSKILFFSVIHGNYLTIAFLTILFLFTGYHNYCLETRTLLVELVRKGIGLFILALLTSFLISAGVHYLQVCHKIFICLLQISDLR